MHLCHLLSPAAVVVLDGSTRVEIGAFGEGYCQLMRLVRNELEQQE